METVIWIAQGVLAAVFAMAGVMKLAQSKAALLASGSMAWAEDFAERQMKGIGALELQRRRLTKAMTAREWRERFIGVQKCSTERPRVALTSRRKPRRWLAKAMGAAGFEPATSRV